MFAYGNAPSVRYRPRLICYVAFQEICETPFTDKTNTGAVFFAMIGEFQLTGQAADIRFYEISEREQAQVELLPRHSLEEIGLILVVVNALEDA